MAFARNVIAPLKRELRNRARVESFNKPISAFSRLVTTIAFSSCPTESLICSLTTSAIGTRSIGMLIWPQWDQFRPIPQRTQYKGLDMSCKSDFRRAIPTTASRTIDQWHNSKLLFKATPSLSGIAHPAQSARSVRHLNAVILVSRSARDANMKMPRDIIPVRENIDA